MFTQTKTLWMLGTILAFACTSQAWFPAFHCSDFLDSDFESVAQYSTPSVVKIKDSHSLNHPPIPTNLDKIKEMIGYPMTAKDAGIEGEVVLRVLVDENGSYVKHSVVESFHPLLRIPCELHAPLIEFKPANREGKISKGWVRIPFSFKISDKKMDQSI